MNDKIDGESEGKGGGEGGEGGRGRRRSKWKKCDRCGMKMRGPNHSDGGHCKGTLRKGGGGKK